MLLFWHKLKDGRSRDTAQYLECFHGKPQIPCKSLVGQKPFLILTLDDRDRKNSEAHCIASQIDSVRSIDVSDS